MTKPFKVDSSDVNKLNDIQLTQLLKELLHAEAFKFDIAQRNVEVALNIRVGDGGEDGRIQWENGPESTDYLPCRLSMFQNKATKMTKAGYAKEILNSDGDIKKKVDDVLSQKGTYIVFTTQELNTKQKDERISEVRRKLGDLKKPYSDNCDIRIYDSAQIAGWVNQFVSIIVSVQHWLRKPLERGLKTYEIWSEHEELSHLPYAPVAHREDLILQLRTDLPTPKSCFRVTGLSGLGKTRTAFQVFAEDESIRNLVVYVDANLTPRIDAVVADWITSGLRTILIVDNCGYRLHEKMVREVRRESSQISLLSLDYNFDTVSAPTIPFRLEQMSDDELLKLLSPVYQHKLPDLERVANFAQGFPQMAVLLAEARLNEDPKIGQLTNDELANKLLWRRGEAENSDYLSILQACSLFDVFGVEKEVEYQLEYIAGLVDLSIDKAYECVQQYSKRGLIDRRGRFGQVVPKPLAIRLAGQWWTSSRERKQKDFVDGIPEDMIEGFCNQVEKMDFHTNVKSLTEKLCGPQGPFGQAEVILSNRGSRLFRAFVNVNPDATSAALYRILREFDHQQLLAVDGNARGNLVWGLEKLCFHAHLFEESAWCMLLLASAENTTWSNNATGLFAQFFSVNLSGTAADPKVRFALLQRALDVNQVEIDMVILRALSQAVSDWGRGRTVGAEHQGTKAPLQEWKATIWQEVFDFWQIAFDFLLVMLERGEAQKAKAMSVIGKSIRAFVSKGRISMLDAAIRKVVEVNGIYWPSALNSINNTFEYDSEGLKKEPVDALNSWRNILDPGDSDLPEKLKILVINPPWEQHKADDGNYIDIAAEKSESLAKEIAKDIHSIFPHLNILLEGEQKQTYIFGRQLARELPDATELLEKTLEHFIATETINPNFALGIYRGIYEKSQDIWQSCIDRLLEEKGLAAFYPNFITTGNIQKPLLDKLLELVLDDVVPVNNANILGKGGVLDGVDQKTISEFCIKLSALGDREAWTALNLLFMYCFRKKKCIDQISSSLKALVIAVPLHKSQKVTFTDIFQWHEMSKSLLKIPDPEFAAALANQLIAACKHEINYGDLTDYIKPLLTDLMREYSEALWPIFSEAIEEAEGMELYKIKNLLDKGHSFSNQQLSILSVLPVEDIISWCLKNPDLGPSFVSSCINILEKDDEIQQPTRLFIALLENFGHDERVISGLTANMGDKSWSGSLIPYLEADKKALTPLLEHASRNVKGWVKEHIAQIDKNIEYESSRDDEFNFGIF